MRIATLALVLIALSVPASAQCGVIKECNKTCPCLPGIPEGDCNGDGIFDIGDAMLMADIANGKADCNSVDWCYCNVWRPNDSGIDILDAFVALKVVMGTPGAFMMSCCP